jgi:trigger factor
MQVSVEETSTLGRKMTVMVPTDKIEAEVAQRLNKLKGNVKIDGFRPGKVPMKMVQQRYGNQVRQEVMADEMQASYRDAIIQEKLRPASAPEIQPQEVEKGKDLSFIANFDVYPEIKLCDFSSISLEVPVVEVTDDDVAESFQRVCKQRMEWSEVDSTAEMGMRATVDFVGKKDGKEFDGGKAEGFQLILGESNMIPGFEEQIVGMVLNQQKEFNITFPEDYGNGELAGQEVSFDITLKKVEKGELPEVNEEFIKSFGIADGTVETLNAEIKKSLEGELQQQLNTKTKQLVMECLLENNDFTLPDSMVKQEITALKQQMQQQMQQNAPTQPPTDFPDNLFEDEAKRRVKIGLMIGEIVNEQKIQVDQNRVEQRIAQFASQYAEYEQVVQYYRTDRQARASVESSVMEDQVTEWILEQVNKKELKQTFKDVVKPRQ